ncbi:triose-phosphate transporter family-domain-containing protein [Hysterangium stoloniferum]|nr:triose-phosphate transporter family-domain-containing protein [Hysterangium stoloniferum]
MEAFTGYNESQRLHLATVKEKKRLWWRNAFITTGCISLWFLFATLLSVYNKWMFSPTRFGFPYTLFVTSLHMWIQFGLAALVRAIWPKHFRPPEKPTVTQYGQKVLPPALATAVDIGLSNTSLKDITLTFYTMVKNSSLIFVLIFAFLFRLEVFSLRLISVMFLILVGVILMVATDTSFSLSGFLLVISASACGGLRWSLTQILLKKDRKQGSMGLDSPPAALFWMTPAMGLILAALSVIVDGWINVFRSRFFDNIATSLMTGVYILIPGIMAFCMVLSEFYIIQRVGVVPMAVAGIFKEVATISVSAWLFGDRLTLLNMFGGFVAFCGIGLFTYHKYRKSIDSPIPLDAHGNPIEVDEDIPESLRLEETRPLAHSGNGNGNGIEFTLRQRSG